MPKIVDHDERRQEFVQAAWRLIIRGGFDAATMAAIAAEAGYANGAIKPYFATKRDLILGVFDHVYDRTARRAAAATVGRYGIDALRAYCRAIMPVTPEALDEARVVIPFWHHALTDAALVDRHEAALTVWRHDLAGYLADARADGLIATAITDRRLVELILTTLHGSQITATLTATGRRAMTRQLDDLIDSFTVSGSGSAT